jgi:two-component system, cell cycle sensor histidine kinase and response regulator CckA
MSTAMQAFQTPSQQNQIAFAFMSDSDLTERRSVTAAGPTIAAALGADASGGEGMPALLPVVAIGALIGMIALALVASGASEPLTLTLLSSLAMLGAFMIFGIAAGHVRIGERVRDDDLVKALADSLEDGILVTSHEGAVIYANKSFQEFLGRTPTGGLQHLEAAFAGEPRAAAALFRLTRAAHRREPWREEIELPRARGQSSRLVRIAHRPCVVPGHEREMGPLVLWSVSDVTEERTRQMRAVHSLEETLAGYDSVPAGLISADAAGHVRHVNATFLRWAGREPLTPSERPLKLADLVPLSGIELLVSAAQSYGGNLHGVDLEVESEGGRTVPMRFYARREASGGLQIAAFNRESEKTDAIDGDTAEIRFARFFQSAPFGIATVGADGRIASANGAFTRMMLDGENPIGAPAAELISRAADPATLAEANANLSRAFAGKVNVTPIEITVGPQNEFSRRVYVSPLTQTRGAREAAVLYVIDATEQKALEAKFAQSSKMEAVGKLAGGIAHDFNNVLTAIIGFSDLLLQTHRPTDPAYKDIMNIRSSATRAAGLVAKLLAFSRRQTLLAEPLQLGQELTEWAPVLKRSLGEKIELKISSGRDLWYVRTDRTQLEHVVLNLANNARDAMPDGGLLTIRSANVTERESQKFSHHGMPVGEYVVVEVKDTGSGMSQDVMAKVFEPFFTTKGIGKGTGLGLATVYGIVKQSGGYIYPESEPGDGTTFRVYLPRHVPENEDAIVAQKSSKKDRAQDLTGSGRVLLVEDEDIVRSFAVRALKRQGYEVLEASTGVEALEVMEKHDHQVDIVVSDVVMPEMDGPTLLKELRQRNPELKIIFVSGYPHEAFETSLDKHQHFAFLPKPFSLPQLAAKVKEQLGR